MTQRIDVTTTKKPVRQFLQELGTLRSPVELVVEDTVVAKLIPPAELSEKEKQRILRQGLAGRAVRSIPHKRHSCFSNSEGSRRGSSGGACASC